MTSTLRVNWLLFCVHRAIGQQLSILHDRIIRLATGGFIGVGETVGNAYNTQCQQHAQNNAGFEGEENHDDDFVWHILPHRDDEVTVMKPYPDKC